MAGRFRRHGGGSAGGSAGETGRKRERRRRGARAARARGGARARASADAKAQAQARTRTGSHGRARAVAGRVVLVVLALAATVVPAVFVNDAIGYVPLLALVLVIACAFAYLQVLKRALSYSEESLLPSCERGTDIEFVLNFKNSSPLVFIGLEPYIYISDLFGGEDVVEPTLMALMPFEDRDFRFQARFDHIGTYSAGVQKIVIRDFLGLFSHTVVNPSHHEVKVLPKLFDVSRVDLTTTSSEESQKAFQAQVSDDMDYAGVRDYQWGDPLKVIHWKLSSRMPEGSYLTRLYETYNEPGISIIMDVTAPAYDSDSLMFIYDGVVESALSVNEYARKRGLDSVLMFVGEHGDTHSLRVLSQAEFTDLTSELPRIRQGEGDAARELLTREGNRIHARDNIAFCTSHADEALVSALIGIKNRKRNPMLLLSVPPALEPAEVKELVRPLRRLDSAQIVYYVISSAADLEGDVGL